MIVVVARILAKPGSEAVVADIVAQSAPGSRADTGCQTYRAYADLEEPTSFMTFEEWDSRADLDAHLAGPGVAALVAALGEHLAAAPTVTAYDVSGQVQVL